MWIPHGCVRRLRFTGNKSSSADCRVWNHLLRFFVRARLITSFQRPLMKQNQNIYTSPTLPTLIDFSFSALQAHRTMHSDDIALFQTAKMSLLFNPLQLFFIDPTYGNLLRATPLLFAAPFLGGFKVATEISSAVAPLFLWVLFAVICILASIVAFIVLLVLFVLALMALAPVCPPARRALDQWKREAVEHESRKAIKQ